MINRTPPKNIPKLGTMADDDKNQSLLDSDVPNFPEPNNILSGGDPTGNIQTPLTSAAAMYMGTQAHQEFVYAVNLHLPQFAPESPDIWFAIAEADFTANRITSDAQKYNQLLKSLPLNIAYQLIDIVSNAPSQNKYETLKTAILQRFSESRQKQIQKLLREKVLGNKKPSQLLREMRELSKNAVTDEVLHQLWTERLPERIRPLLVISDNLNDLNALAETADRIMDALVSNSVMSVHNSGFPSCSQQVSNSPDLTKIERQLLEMRLMLECCQQDIKNLQSTQQQLQHQTQHHQPQPHVQRPRTRSITPNRSGVCYYHTRWGNDARHCTKPCKFTTPTQNQGN